MKRKIVMAGGSGFLGTRLAGDLLDAGDEVVILTRNPGPRNDGVREVHWNAKTTGAWSVELNGAHAVVNLAGRSVNCRHTEENRRLILESRIDSVKAIESAMKLCAHPPAVWVQASSLAIYGSPGDRWCDETSPAASDFSASVCLEWERTFFAAAVPGVRKAALRIGFVLDSGRGALSTLARLVRCFLGGATGNGRQYISWIHWSDLNRMFRWAIDRNDIAGIFNATSPQPVTNAEFMRALRKALGRPWSPPAPAWAVRLGALILRTEASLVLTGRRCGATAFLARQFAFQFGGIEPALTEIYRNRKDFAETQKRLSMF